MKSRGSFWPPIFPRIHPFNFQARLSSAGSLMEPTSSTSPVIKKQEDDDKTEKRDIKPVPKTLNRVPRACNACRKQKMRCEGADNPPCRRCRNTGLECLFEKPSREATLTGEAGLERIRSLEAHVADIRQTQNTISSTLAELVHHLRNGGFTARSPSAYPSSSFHQSPGLNSPSISTPTVSHQHASPPTATTTFTSSSHGSGANLPQPRPQRTSLPGTNYSGSSVQSAQSLPSEDVHQSQLSPMYGNFPPGGQSYNAHNQPSQGPVLPPFSSIQTMGPPVSQQGNISSIRFQSSDPGYQRSSGKYSSGAKRNAPPSSNVTSADSSDLDDDDGGELPASGLLAPWEVLRGLADVAIERAAKENGDSSEPHSRTRTPSPERQSRPSKRRKIRHKLPHGSTFPDVVTKGIITEAEARELFKIFYDGCSTFLPVFDSNMDTFDALHERSPFAVDTICMVAARVRDGGGKPSEIHRRCLEEVQAISSATLFAPVLRSEAVQSMILVSGWSDNGWLSGGHAVRMAMELSMHKAWPRLLKRMNANKADASEDRQLIIASRTWFCLYLFEHQLSYGTGRPAVLKDDESIRDCRYILNHPLAIEDDMRLVSTVELIAIRERVHNALAPFEGPVKPEDFEELHRANNDFMHWYKVWDEAFSRKYEDAAFYRQSLQIQHLHAELFHNATALRGIIGPEDVQNMPPAHRTLAIRSIQIARQGLDITVNSPAYRKGMTYAVHYTHATATFAASFLLRLARLFPSDCDMMEIRNQVERLANLMAEIPGKRYALTLQLMLKRSKKRKGTSSSRSPKISRDSQRSLVMAVDHPPHSASMPSQHGNSEPFSPVYDMVYSQENPGHVPSNPLPQHYPHLPHPNFAEAEQIWRGLEQTSAEQLPVWISDQSLGGQSFSQHGMDAFIIPTDYLPPTTQIW
ncbi:hypothetical protein GALMADRAFT_234194 [Galerina marginata CBS 339.88]|uniref:Zn(2)-C6 fungal-type domain-containing protein n=1 Tax=Galerina marginata (strain CBS 339.88) TaxID=685588 RepID=A0A067U1X9_GALM3|nr:hypothetical protein GALMADRAFT_234194 [Galerina marginata CBS 339.88]